MATGGNEVTTQQLQSNVDEDGQVLTTRKLHEIIEKLSVQDQTKTHHEFWDTQPVPKLG